MESGTGGYLANTITEVPASTVYFKGGVVVSSPVMPLAYGVPAEVLQQHGTVSQESAVAMAQAIRGQLGADFGIGITGVPGPQAIEGQPVGLAYFAIAGANTIHVEEMGVAPRRMTLKRRVSNAALIALSKLLRGERGAQGYHW
jgi:PncC family amidohydrolase